MPWRGCRLRCAMKNVRTYTLALLFACAVVCPALAGTGKTVSLMACGTVLRGAEVVVWWVPEDNVGVVGFYLERLDPAKGVFVRVQNAMVSPIIPSYSGTERCEAADAGAAVGRQATYRVVAVWTDRSVTTSEAFTLTPSAVEAAAQAAPFVPVAAGMPWVSPSVPGDRVKICVESNGLYFVSAESIAAALDGWSPSAVSSAISEGLLRMSCGTNDVAWLGADGGGGVFFFGEAIASIFTRQNVYWLDPGTGTVMQAFAGAAPAAAPTGPVYRAGVHYETDLYSMFADFACTNVDADIWFWAFAQGGTASSNAVVKIVATGVSPAPQVASLTAHLHGGQISTGDSSDFRLKFFLNDVYLGTTNWGGRTPCDPSFCVTNLVEGTNTFKMQAFKLAGDTPSTFSLLQSIDLEFDRLYVPMGSQVICSGGSNQDLTVSGFATSDLQVFDITRAATPVKLDAALIDDAPGGGYRVSFTPASPTNRYLVSAGAWAPASVTGRRMAGWRASSNAFEFVAIAPPGFVAQAQELADYRAAQGVVSAVADVTSIYDEFNWGVVHPLAVRSFISNAVCSWAAAPRYVVLAGAGNLNYRNVDNTWSNDPCLIPPVTIYSTTTSRLGGSDTPLADIDGDRVPDVAIGRLPFATTNEFKGWLDKMRAFESNAIPWRTVSMTAGWPDDAGDFSSSSDGLAARLPKTYAADKNYASTQTLAQVRSRLFKAFNSGCSLLTYVGHGNRFQLADQGGTQQILTMNDVLALTNRMSAPIMLGMTCEFGRYERPLNSTNGRIGDRLLRQSAGGAVAVWSSVTIVANDDSVRLGGFLLERLFSRDDARLGQSIREAMVMEKAGRPDSHLLESYNLLGDPAMRTRLIGKRGFTLIVR